MDKSYNAFTALCDLYNPIQRRSHTRSYTFPVKSKYTFRLQSVSGLNETFDKVFENPEYDSDSELLVKNAKTFSFIAWHNLVQYALSDA